MGRQFKRDTLDLELYKPYCEMSASVISKHQYIFQSNKKDVPMYYLVWQHTEVAQLQGKEGLHLLDLH